MSGADPPEAHQFKGIRKYFNCETNFGRANYAKTTYALIGLFIAYKMLSGGKKKE